jgi:hypothetical protein
MASRQAAGSSAADEAVVLRALYLMDPRLHFDCSVRHDGILWDWRLENSSTEEQPIEFCHFGRPNLKSPRHFSIGKIQMNPAPGARIAPMRPKRSCWGSGRNGGGILARKGHKSGVIAVERLDKFKNLK